MLIYFYNPPGDYFIIKILLTQQNFSFVKDVKTYCLFSHQTLLN